MKDFLIVLVICLSLASALAYNSYAQIKIAWEKEAAKTNANVKCGDE